MLKEDVAPNRPRTVEGLVTCIYDSWKNLDKTSIMNTFDSIYNRVGMLIEGEGEPLDY